MFWRVSIFILTLHCKGRWRWSGGTQTIVSDTSVLSCIWLLNICYCQAVIPVLGRDGRSWICCYSEFDVIFFPNNIRSRVSCYQATECNSLSFHFCGTNWRFGNFRPNLYIKKETKTKQNRTKIKKMIDIRTVSHCNVRLNSQNIAPLVTSPTRPLQLFFQ